MGIEVSDSPVLGRKTISVNYRQENIGMEPTISKAMDDHDRMDWLERSITSIRRVLEDHGMQIQVLDSGYGRVISRIGDLQVTVEGYRQENIDREEELKKWIDEAFLSINIRLDKVLPEASLVISNISTNIDTITNKLSTISDTQYELFKLISELQGTTTQLILLQSKKKWYQFWRKDI